MWIEAKTIAGMVPWVCSYTSNGRRFGITLYATDPEQLIEDNCDLLPDLQIDGQLLGIVEEDDE